MEACHRNRPALVLIIGALTCSGPVFAEESGGNDFGNRDALVEYLSQGSTETLDDASQSIDSLNEDLATQNEGDPAAEAALDDLNTGKVLLDEGEDELAVAEAELQMAIDAEDDDAIAAAEQKKMDAESKISAAEEQIMLASDALIAANPDNEPLIDDLNQAEMDRDSALASIDGIGSVVDEMSDEQVYWSNQKFQNAKSSGLVVDIPLEELEKFPEYDFHQINSATKAFEAEAKFTQIADKFAEDSKQHDMFLARSESQRDKFLAKVERFGDETETTGSIDKADLAGLAKREAKAAAKSQAAWTTKDSATDLAKNEAKGVAKGAARDASKDVTRGAAKLAAKDTAKNAAKDSAKQVAKQIVQEEGRSVGRSLAKEEAKQNGKNGAKENARENGKNIAKEQAKENGKNAAKG